MNQDDKRRLWDVLKPAERKIFEIMLKTKQNLKEVCDGQKES